MLEEGPEKDEKEKATILLEKGWKPTKLWDQVE